MDQRMPVNVLNSLIEYTTLQIDTQENIVPLSSDELFRCPFCYLSGHKLVEFTTKERENFEKYIRNGGFVFVDDCNHDIDGLFSKSFETQMEQIFGAKALIKIPNNHAIYSSFFEFAIPRSSFQSSIRIICFTDNSILLPLMVMRAYPEKFIFIFSMRVS